MYRKNVAGQYLYFALVNATTGAALTGATVTGKRAIDGAAQASVTGTITEEAGGQYKIALSQADTNGNNIGYLFTATNAIPVSISIVTTAADPTDAASFGITRIDAAISSRSTYAGADTAGTTTLLARVPGTVQPQTGDSYARLGAPAGASVSADVAALPTANANADALLDRANGIETGWTPRQTLRIMAAAVAAKLSGAAGATVTIRNITDTKDRITATVDASGNRTAVVLDGA